jgi:MtN3 and saliva related transmembrane protein
MTGVDILGYGACAVTALTFLPQVLKTWKERSAKNVSLTDVYHSIYE